MRKCFVAAILALMAAQTAVAQNLTKAQEGRKAVGQCYSACLKVDSAGPVAWIAMYWDNWREAADWTAQEWGGFISMWQATGCTAAQVSVIALYACGQGCIDVERAYGVSSSFARTAFRHELAEATSELRGAGLWNTTNRNAPQAGTVAFQQACTRYFTGSASAAGSARLDAYKSAYLSVDKEQRAPAIEPAAAPTPGGTLSH